MKVLWFSNTPSMAEDHLIKTPSTGGWIRSLEKEMRDKVELNIAFYYTGDISNIKNNKTKYYPILVNDRNNLIGKIRTRIFNQLQPKSDILKFKEIVDIVKPDLIHIHGSELPYGLVQTISNIPTVMSIQGVITLCEKKYFSGISYYNVLKYSTLKNRLFFTTELINFKRIKNQSKREKQIYSITKNIIGRTDWDRRVASTLAPNSQYYHNDEILKDTFYQGLWNNKLKETINLFTTSGTNLYKGIETLIYCASLLDNNNVKFKWRVAGVSKTDEIITLAVKSTKRKLSPNIEFLGKVHDEIIKQSIFDCNIYLCISHIENSPNSLCEALILGAPCISTNAGGISNLINNGETGILLQNGDPYSMAGAIVELKNNYDKAINFGIKSRQKALIRHDKNVIAVDLLNIYKKILHLPPSNQ